MNTYAWIKYGEYTETRVNKYWEKSPNKLINLPNKLINKDSLMALENLFDKNNELKNKEKALWKLSE